MGKVYNSLPINSQWGAWMGDILDFREFRKKRQSAGEYDALVDAQDELFGSIKPTFLEILLTETSYPEDAGTFERLAHEVQSLNIFLGTHYSDYKQHHIVNYRAFVEKAAVFFFRNRQEEGPEVAAKAYNALRDLYYELREQEPKDKRPITDFDERIMEEALTKYHQK